MTKARAPGAFTGNVEGPWRVDTIGKAWYVIHSLTLRAKHIGPVGARHANYFDRAIAEADRRNKEST